MNIFSVFLESGLAAQIIMAVLVVCSVWSWAVFLKKMLDLAGTRKRSQAFLSVYRFHRTLKDYDNLGHLLNDNPFGRVMKTGLDEYKDLKSGNLGSNPRILELAENIKMAMTKARNDEIDKLGSWLPSLSTIMTAGPFLGLLGTVWGIMEAFLEVRARGSAHITVVAPGISDALITTVYGLLVAIPALFFHNYLRGAINKVDNQLDDFVTETFAKFRRGFIETE
jgi:biopolymer transport protein TolQ